MTLCLPIPLIALFRLETLAGSACHGDGHLQDHLQGRLQGHLACMGELGRI